MKAPWLDIIGIGEDGLDGLSPAALEALRKAEVILGGDRHHRLAPDMTGRRISWPSPFNAMIDEITSHRGRAMAVLVTGDPLWYSVGARIARAIPGDEIRFHPQLSAFQLAAVRLGWSLADCDTLTVHGRADSQIVPHVSPNNRLLILTQNGDTPKDVAEILDRMGYGDSRLVVLAAMGGANEQRIEGIAARFDTEVPDFHLLAVECRAGAQALVFPRAGGLPDSAFVHDGKMTKQDVRAATLAKLAPFPDALLWDVGAGCGSVGIEWMRAARSARCIAIEPQEKRLAMIRKNARLLGAEKIDIVEASAPEALDGLPTPDAVFIGGGMSEATFQACWSALRPGGRLVANAVTLESEALLLDLHRREGGDLTRIAVSKAESVGPFRGWRNAMPVTQWALVKPWEDKG